MNNADSPQAQALSFLAQCGQDLVNRQKDRAAASALARLVNEAVAIVGQALRAPPQPPQRVQATPPPKPASPEPAGGPEHPDSPSTGAASE